MKNKYTDDRLPEGTVTFLFTDIEGSTELLKALGDIYAELLSQQRELLRDIFNRWGGQEVDTQGDSFFVSFPRATQAVSAAVEIQQTTQNFKWPEDVEVRLRMGLHTGEPLTWAEGYVGIDVHRAARIAAVGHGGQVLLSETTTALILDELPEGVSILDLGRHLLKDVSRPEHIRQLVIEGLPSEFPPLTTLEKLPSVELREPRQIGECPYQGLAAFREENADFFFGREDFTGRLMEAVETRPLIAVIVGSSGSGKSSAVFAGLIPQLRKKKGWSISQFRPGSQPLNALITALLPTLEPDLSTTERLVEARKLADAVKAGGLPIYDVINLLFEKNPEIDQLMLVVDQFEELYTLCPDEELRGRFKDELLDVVLATSGKRKKKFVLLLTLRADFMGQALMHRPFADALQKASQLMGPMTRGELKSAIEKPAELQGAVFEPGLVERILDDVGEKPGNLPLLEFALTLLWEAQTDGWLTHTDYEAIGSVDGALARYADEVFESLEKKDQEQARRIFVQLVKPGEGTEDTRRVATRAELTKGDWGLVQHLADRRLVVTGRDTEGNETVEVVHEALIQRWGQLQRWMQEDRDFRSWQERLRLSARIWGESDRDVQALLRGLPLAEAEKWWMERRSELGSAEEEFIQTSLGERDERRKAEEARQEREARQVSIGISSQAALELQGTSPERAVPLALEALENYPYTWQAERALGEAVFSNHVHLRLQHEAYVNSALWSPDQTRILTAADDKTAKVWDASTGALLFTFQHDYVPNALWSPTGDRILTQFGGIGEVEGSINVWDAATYELVRSIPNIPKGKGFFFQATDWSPGGNQVLVCNSDGCTRVWDITTGNQLFRLGAPWVGGPLGCIGGYRAWSPSGDRILTRDFDGGIQIWDAATGEAIHQIVAHSDKVTKVAWSPGGDRVVSNSKDGTLKIWDAVTGVEVHNLVGHHGGVFVVAWSPTGNYVLSTDDQRIAIVWDSQTGEELLKFKEHNYSIETAAWSPSGEIILTGSGDGSAKIWNPLTGNVAQTFLGHDSEISFTGWSPDGKQIVTSGEDGLVYIWNVSSEKELLHIDGSEAAGYVLDWSSDDTQLARGYTDGHVEIYDARSGDLQIRFKAHQSRVMWGAFSPKGDLIVTTSEDETANVWDASNGELRSVFNRHIGHPSSAKWSPNGSRIATACYLNGGAVRIWDPVSGEEQLVFSNNEHWGVIQSKWSPDGSRIASVAVSGEALIWDARTGELQLSLYPNENRFRVWAVAWSPDGDRLATHAQDGILRIWDTQTGNELFATPGHSSLLINMDWRPSSERLITGDHSGVFKMFDTRNGTEVFSAQIPNYQGMVLSPDGTRFATSSLPGGPIKIFSLWNSLEELIEYARKNCVIRELTPMERERFGLLEIT